MYGTARPKGDTREMTNRLEIQIDAEHRHKLDELAHSRRFSISDLVRALLDREYEEWLRTQRMRAARVISAVSAEEVPEPDLLDQQLGNAYEPPLC